jgi:vacuolar protein sorting-associated protein 35
MATPPAVEDQARLLDDALTVVRQQSHLMRKCLETPGKLMDALKCRYEAAHMISESRQLNARAAQWMYLDLVLTGHPQ